MNSKIGRDDAKSAMAQAAGVREKEAGTFAKTSADLKTNIGALDKAIPAIENGMGGSFVQTQAAAGLKNFVMLKSDLADVDREDLLAFLSNTDGYAPQSGQIVGILKTLHDEMTKELSDATAAEDAAIKTYEELVAAKTKEVEALTAQIEEKSVRLGELSVDVATMKNDLEDTTEAVAEDTKFAADLEKQCASKEAEWDERCKTRTEEVLAIADTIKILNDDDALELFKKTLPAPTLVQIKVSAKEVQQSALSTLHTAKTQDPRIAFIALTLQGGSKSFDKVIKMIDEMVVLLGEEQTADDDKKAYCEKEIDTAEDEKKVLENRAAISRRPSTTPRRTSRPW